MGFNSVQFNSGGLYTSIQDGGRFGYKNEGVPESGAIDKWSMTLANWLAFNTPNHPVVEVTSMGVSFTVSHPIMMGISGGEAVIEVNKVEVDRRKTIHLKANDRVRVNHIIVGFRLYISFSGVLRESEVLDSYSTYPLAQLGILKGKLIEKDTHIIFEKIQLLDQTRMLPMGYQAKLKQKIIRFIPGPEWSHLNEHDQNIFKQNEYTVSSQSNRMGIRLHGPSIECDFEMISSPVSPGVIQLTNEGKLIIILNDGQTIGGYPRIGFVTRFDMDVLAQKGPREQIKFKQIDSEESEYLCHHQIQKVAYLYSKE